MNRAAGSCTFTGSGSCSGLDLSDPCSLHACSDAPVRPGSIRRRGQLVPKISQFTVDAPISPARIVPGHLQCQRPLGLDARALTGLWMRRAERRETFTLRSVGAGVEIPRAIRRLVDAFGPTISAVIGLHSYETV